MIAEYEQSSAIKYVQHKKLKLKQQHKKEITYKNKIINVIVYDCGEITEIEFLVYTFKEVEEPDTKFANIHWIIEGEKARDPEKAREFQKNNYFCLIDYTKAFDCMDHKNC